MVAPAEPSEFVVRAWASDAEGRQGAGQATGRVKAGQWFQVATEVEVPEKGARVPVRVFASGAAPKGALSLSVSSGWQLRSGGQLQLADARDGVLWVEVAPEHAEAHNNRGNALRLLGRADELAWELHQVRSQAILRNQRLRITFGQDSGGSCYVVLTGASRDCVCASDGTANCTVQGLLPVKSVSLPLGQGPQLASNVSSMVVDPLLGTVTPAATVRVIGRTGQEVRHVISLTGRIRSCTAPRALSRHPAC